MTPAKSIRLEADSVSGGKFYAIQIRPTGEFNAYAVDFQYGAIGGTPKTGTRTARPVPLTKAEEIFAKLVLEKMNGESHYRPVGGDAAAWVAPDKPAAAVPAGIADDFRPMLPNFITPEQAEKLLGDPAWCMQEKADGVNAIILVNTADQLVSTASRTDKPVSITPAIRAALLETFKFSKFAAIATEVCGSSLVIFDLLQFDTFNLRRNHSCASRLDALDDYAAINKSPVLNFIQTVRTEADKRAALAILRQRGAEGVVFKRLDAPYRDGKLSPGDLQVCLKWKFKASVTVVVLGHNKEGKRSVDVGLRDHTPVGAVTIPAKWGPLPTPGTLIEVEYLNALRGGRLFQPAYKGVRDDVEADGPEALQYKGEER